MCYIEREGMRSDSQTRGIPLHGLQHFVYIARLPAITPPGRGEWEH